MSVKVRFWPTGGTKVKNAHILQIVALIWRSVSPWVQWCRVHRCYLRCLWCPVKHSDQRDEDKEAKLYEEPPTFMFCIGCSPLGLEPPPLLLDLEVQVNPWGKDNKEGGKIAKRGRWIILLFLYVCYSTIWVWTHLVSWSPWLPLFPSRTRWTLNKNKSSLYKIYKCETTV